ncbi:DEAD/DEAH box helicase family protein [Escherichia coli]|nr:DEAD/DEAH box helicase family protein [Escherichia coli]
MVSSQLTIAKKEFNLFRSGNLPIELWEHQRDALNFLIKRLNQPLAGTSVVRMPTGTGKTGVIAWLSMMSNEGITLVLTPWTNLRNQMIDDLTSKFWSKSGLPTPNLKVFSLLPSNVEKLLSDENVKVIVSSLAALTDLRRDNPVSYAKIKNLINLVIVDEGHYEPAVEWGKSVKHLERPTVLMTATPYRNDLKLFRITHPEESVWQFKHYQAQEKGIIRPLDFHSLDSTDDINKKATDFSRFWNESVQNKSLASSQPRAIICCSDSLSIKKVVHKLRELGISTLGVHDRFKNEPSIGLYKDVPHINTDADVWVHQHKLVEGLDDSRFCCIALFCPILNDRRLVQQVGRILRVSKNDNTNMSAILLSPEEFNIQYNWQSYLEFEKDAKLVTVNHYRDVVDKLLNMQPAAEYFGGRFRKKFEPLSLSKDSNITISPSVLIRIVNKNFSMDSYISDCTDTLLMNDAVILGHDAFGPCVKGDDHALWIYVSIRNSRLLSENSMYEIRLEAHCAVISDGYLLISDTSGSYPVEFIEDFTSGIAPRTLSSLIDKTFKLTNLSMSSVIPFDNVVRAAEIRSPDIAKIPASLTDRIQICRSARGTSKIHGRRYVGIKRGRIRQELSAKQLQNHSLFTYVRWCQQVTQSLKDESAGADVFSRYMQTSPPPNELIAKTICIDLIRVGLDLLGPDDVLVQAKLSATDLEPIGKGANLYKFTLEFETISEPNKIFTEEIFVEYQTLKKRFWFKLGDEKNIRVAIDNQNYPHGKSLPDFFNLNQDLILIGLDGGEVVYQGRNFYKISYSTAEQSLLDRIITLDKAAKCKTEKGTEVQLNAAKGLNGNSIQDEFPTESLFSAIVLEKDIIPFEADLLICDDLNTECCDFLAADTKNKKLALLHAKTGSGFKISASAFHEVVSQAIKNLVYLSPNAEIPQGVNSWKKGVYWNKTKIERVIYSPQGSAEGEDLWKNLNSGIVKSSNSELHVVLVTTGCCNRQSLQDAINNKNKRTPETAQLFHLLEGLNGYSRQLGIRLTIVDIPFDNSLVLEKREKAKKNKLVNIGGTSKGKKS